MAENLKTTSYNDESAINPITDNAQWSTQNEGAYCWYKNSEEIYKNTFGALYNWYAVSSGHLCPAGWKVPSDPEYLSMLSYLDGSSGSKLKETRDRHWPHPNDAATNESGFTSIPAGYRN